MDRHREENGARKRGPLIPWLLACLGLQGCLYLGLRAAPALSAAGWRPRTEALSSRVARWRRAQYEPGRDPAPGSRLPVLRLPRPGGGTVALADGRRRTALLFVSDDAG